MSSFHNNNDVNKTFSQILENNLVSTFGRNELLLMLRNLISLIRLFINLKAKNNVENIEAFKPVARQRPGNKKLCDSPYYVTPPRTSKFPKKQFHCTREMVFSTRSVSKYYKQN
jgi:hypothetical protein